MRAVVILMALIGAAMAVPKSSNRIVGGSNTDISQYPFMSNMNYLFDGWYWSHSCGGSLISNRYVLSASHCYSGDHPTEWRVRFGFTYASSGGTIVNVAQIIMHPSYSDATLDNDIALLRLSSNVAIGGNIQTIPIAGSSYNIVDGSTVTSIGWGTLTYLGSAPEILQHVNTNIINHKLCAERYAYLKTRPGYQGWPDITSRMLCAGILNVGGRDACQGDSGGPLTQNGVLVGVTSWGFECADAYYPGVNALVPFFVDWINKNTN